MSTFGSLNIAYTGLVAARRGLDVTGANIVNAGSETYTRQRVTATALDPLARTGLLPTGTALPQGVDAETIVRLSDSLRDARVGDANGALGTATRQAQALGALEALVAEPGDDGLGAALDAFWTGWQDVANQPGEAAPVSVLLSRAQAVVDRLGGMRTGAEAEWSDARSALEGVVRTANADAASLADLNERIRTGSAAGANVGTLLDERDRLAGQLAGLVGGTVRHREDGMVDVVVDGDAIVMGTTARALSVSGAAALDSAAGSPVALEWSHRPGIPLSMSRGEAAGLLSALAPTGALASFATALDAVASDLAAAVNTAHAAGATPDGSTGLAFFAVAAGAPPARGLSILATGVDQVATGAVGAGAADGSVADAISQLGSAPGGPDDAWSTLVADLGAQSRSALDRLERTTATAVMAVDAQRSQAGVSLDEENIALIGYQQSYQAAARVLTTIDEMLDVLINRTGVVGR